MHMSQLPISFVSDDDVTPTIILFNKSPIKKSNIFENYIFHLFRLPHHLIITLLLMLFSLPLMFSSLLLPYKVHKSKSACNNINLSCFMLDVNIEFLFLSNNYLTFCAPVCILFLWRRLHFYCWFFYNLACHFCCCFVIQF